MHFIVPQKIPTINYIATPASKMHWFRRALRSTQHSCIFSKIAFFFLSRNDVKKLKMASKYLVTDAIPYLRIYIQSNAEYIVQQKLGLLLNYR